MNDTVETTSKTYWQQGRDCLDKGYIEEGIELCRLAVETAPESADAHFNLGRAIGRLGHGEEEMKEYREAIKLDPRHADSLNNIGAHYYRHTRYDEALASFMAGAACAPEDWFILKNIGMVLCRMQRFEEAISWLKESVRLESNNEAGHSYLAQACHEIVREKWKASTDGQLDPETVSLARAAIAAARAVIAINPKDEGSYTIGADTSVMIRDIEGEVDFLEAAIRALPRFHVPYLWLASCYIDYCDSDPDALREARRLLDEAECLDPDSPWLGQLKMKLAAAHTEGVMQSRGGSGEAAKPTW